MTKITIGCTVNEAICESLKKAVEIQDKLSIVSKNIKFIKKYAKELDCKLEMRVVFDIKYISCDIQTIPYPILNDKYWLYLKRYVKYANKDISIKLTKENIYDRHFNIQLGNFELLYENAVYLELILAEMRHRLIHDMIFMIYDYHYYKPKCDNYYFYRTETPIDDIDRNDFEELIIWFLENKHRYKVNKYFTKDMTNWFIGKPNRYIDRIIDVISKYSKYFEELIKMTPDIIEDNRANWKIN